MSDAQFRNSPVKYTSVSRTKTAMNPGMGIIMLNDIHVKEWFVIYR